MLGFIALAQNSRTAFKTNGEEEQHGFVSNLNLETYLLCILAGEYETEYYYKYSLCPETIHQFVKEFPLNERKFKFNERK